jgi:hypothetical protein
MAASSGFYQKALDLLHWAMPAVLYRCTAAAIKKASMVGPFFDIVLFAVALAAAGAIRSKSLDMPHIRQCLLYCSGAPPWPSKWPTMEVHVLFATSFLLAIIVAKDHVMVH